MWAAIISFIINLITTLFEKGQEAVKFVYDKVSTAASGFADSVVEWFEDDEVSLTEKIAVVTGAAYLVAPETTTDVITSAVEGVGDTAGVIIEETAEVADSFFNSSWMKYLLIAGAAWLGYKMFIDKPDVVVSGGYR